MLEDEIRAISGGLPRSTGSTREHSVPTVGAANAARTAEVAAALPDLNAGDPTVAVALDHARADVLTEGLAVASQMRATDAGVATGVVATVAADGATLLDVVAVHRAVGPAVIGAGRGVVAGERAAIVTDGAAFVGVVTALRAVAPAAVEVALAMDVRALTVA
jgi:hypothetical protein